MIPFLIWFSPGSIFNVCGPVLGGSQLPGRIWSPKPSQACCDRIISKRHCQSGYITDCQSPGTQSGQGFRQTLVHKNSCVTPKLHRFKSVASPTCGFNKKCPYSTVRHMVVKSGGKGKKNQSLSPVTHIHAGVKYSGFIENVSGAWDRLTCESSFSITIRDVQVLALICPILAGLCSEFFRQCLCLLGMMTSVIDAVPLGLLLLQSFRQWVLVAHL